MTEKHPMAAFGHTQKSPNLFPKTPTAVQVQTTQTMVGPLPPPTILEGYEKTCPGAADRIIKMAELEQSHRHVQEGRFLRHSSSLIALGQILGFLVALFGISCGTYLVYKGRDATGLACVITTLVALVSVYIYGRASASKEAKALRAKQGA
jgi:uncharacterized membrane protein